MLVVPPQRRTEKTLEFSQRVGYRKISRAKEPLTHEENLAEETKLCADHVLDRFQERTELLSTAAQEIVRTKQTSRASRDMA